MATDERTQEEGSPEQIEAEIEATREELGDTAAALADKADVKKQAKRKVDDAKAKATSKADGLKHAARAKKDEVVGNVQGTAPNSAQGAAAQASRTADQARATRENPVPAAAAGGFAAGILVGWILGRR
jgi:hypothetical protein